MIELEDEAGSPAAEDMVLAEAGADPELLDAMTPAEEQPRSRRSLQGRIDELTRGRREAEREAEYWREVALEAQAALDAQGELSGDDGGPNPEDYVHGEEDADYIRDRALFEAAQDYQRQADAFARAHEDHRHNEAFTARARAAADRLPDFEAVVFGTDDNAWPCTAEMAQAIKTSEVGPELAYCLACNPDEAHRIAALPHASQIRELGRLEGRLQHHVEASAAPERKTATTAPEPPPMLRGSGSRFAIAPDTNDFAAFDKQYG